MIDIEKFICSLLADHPVGVAVREDIHKALKDQGLEYKGGKIVPIVDKTELKESGGERIREELLNAFQEAEDSLYMVLTPHRRETFIAWLEKRGEKGTNGNERETPFAVWSKDDEKIYSRIYDLIHNAAYANYDVDEDGKELGEYAKIAEWFKSIKDRVQPQPKQEWSKEDERMLGKCIDAASGYYYPPEERQPMKDWLRTIKDRIQPQNLTVTDEELAQAKKDAYNDALDKIEYHSGEPTFDDGWSAAIWYLKKRNAKLQNQWKPSKEQMKFLWKYAEQNNYDGRILTSLFNDLKKLKGM